MLCLLRIKLTEKVLMQRVRFPNNEQAERKQAGGIRRPDLCGFRKGGKYEQ